MVRQKSKGRRLARLVLWVSLALIVVVVGAVFGISGYAAYSMTKVERVPIEENPADFGLKYANISFSSRDGLTLRGWWLEAGDDKRIIVMVHGGEGHRADPGIKMLDIARELISHGYNVLMFDLRGHGESEGKHLSAGYHEKKDLLGAIDYIRERGMSEIGVLGFSMGAATSLMTAAQCEEIDAVVADSSYADLRDIMKSEFSKRSNLPSFFIPLILFMAKNIYGADFAAVKPIEAVREITARPVFIIQGGQDDIVPVQHARSLREASRNPRSKLWVVPEAKHVSSYVARPEEYTNKVISFFDDALDLKR